jgi:uncharacterized protein YjbI with pentapeptide repeats
MEDLEETSEKFIERYQFSGASERKNWKLSAKDLSLLVSFADDGRLELTSEGRIDVTYFDFSDMDFRDDSIDVNLFDFSGCKFENSVFDRNSFENFLPIAKELKLDLSGIKLENTNLDPADVNSEILGTKIVMPFDLSDLILRNAKFDYSSLREVIFSNSILDGASFKKTDLSDANFDNAKIYNANFEEAIVKIEQLLNAEGLDSIVIENLEELLQEVSNLKVKQEQKENIINTLVHKIGLLAKLFGVGKEENSKEIEEKAVKKEKRRQYESQKNAHFSSQIASKPDITPNSKDKDNQIINR